MSIIFSLDTSCLKTIKREIKWRTNTLRSQAKQCQLLIIKLKEKLSSTFFTRRAHILGSRNTREKMLKISIYLRKLIKAHIPICDDLDSDFLSCCWSIPSRSDSHLKSLHHEMIQFSNQILFYLKAWSLPLSLFWNTK